MAGILRTFAVAPGYTGIVVDSNRVVLSFKYSSYGTLHWITYWRAYIYRVSKEMRPIALVDLLYYIIKFIQEPVKIKINSPFNEHSKWEFKNFWIIWRHFLIFFSFRFVKSWINIYYHYFFLDKCLKNERNINQIIK